MKVAETKAELTKLLSHAPGPRVLVPTMGALHEGHLALIRRARKAAGSAGTVIVSIFVNPIQFDRPSDLVAYPKPLENDLIACGAMGVDIAFTPEAKDMYFPNRSIAVTEASLATGLCGSTRPGHFDGVCTVVLKLFNLTGCDAAIFGEKDFQQLAIIRRMVRDLDVPVEILACGTVRESDGLAMSSRNARLTAEERADAPRIQLALSEAVMHKSAQAILKSAREAIKASPFARIDYLELVDAETLEILQDLNLPAILATAVFYGDVRLIDHVSISGTH